MRRLQGKKARAHCQPPPGDFNNSISAPSKRRPSPWRAKARPSRSALRRQVEEGPQVEAGSKSRGATLSLAALSMALLDGRRRDVLGLQARTPTIRPSAASPPCIMVPVAPRPMLAFEKSRGPSGAPAAAALPAWDAPSPASRSASSSRTSKACDHGADPAEHRHDARCRALRPGCSRPSSDSIVLERQEAGAVGRPPAGTAPQPTRGPSAPPFRRSRPR